jgi:hypothetical protein
MHKSLDDYLCKKYPKIFANRQKTCMCWGFPGNGWLFLIDSLCENIQNYIDNPPWQLNEKTGKYENPKKPTCPQVVALQVKEKFGGLRFYCRGGDHYTNALIAMAESMSYRICENCGKMDETVSRNSKRWIKTTCENCTKLEDKKDHQKNRDKKLIKAWKNVRS